MTLAKLVLDTNILIDFLDERDQDYKSTRLLMLAGKVGEFSLWISSSQVTDLIYILSDGGKAALMPDVLERIRKLRTFINVYATGESEIDAMIADAWSDPEDALIFEMALSLHADAIISRNAHGFEEDAIPVCNSSEFFEWFKSARGISYDEITVSDYI